MKYLNYTDIFKNIDDLTVENIWAVYANAIFKGVNASPIQFSKTKEAFFVGFSECFRVMNDISDNLEEQKANDVLTRLCDESNKFINDLIREKLT